VSQSKLTYYVVNRHYFSVQSWKFKLLHKMWQ